MDASVIVGLASVILATQVASLAYCVRIEHRLTRLETVLKMKGLLDVDAHSVV